MPSEKAMEIIRRMLESSKPEELSKLIDGIREGTFQYIVAFDMGCGNTSSAIGSIQVDSIEVPVSWKYRYMDSYGEWKETTDNSLPTILGYNEDHPVIGPEAIRYGEVAENFKNIPSERGLNAPYGVVGDKGIVTLKQVWGDFFRAAFNSALNFASTRIQNPAPSKKNVIFVVAHPADESWNDHLSTYKKLICEATGLRPCQVVTFSEAKASMQYVRVKKNYPVSWTKGVVMVDLGASTIDVEYLAYDQPPLEYSITMAGQHVDRLLGHYVLQQVYPSEMAELEADELPDDTFFRTHKKEISMNKKAFSYYMRMMKESICTTLQPAVMRFKIDGQIQNIEVDRNKLQYILETTQFPFVCYNPDIANAMNGVRETYSLNVRGTWYSHVEKIVRYLFDQIMKSNHATDTIIVTGGTAKLVGVREAVMAGAQAAGVNNVNVIVMNESYDYEKTVPFGSLSYIRNVITHTDDILSFPDKLYGKVEADLSKYVSLSIRKAIYPYICRKINETLDEWERLPEGDAESSLNGMVRMVQKICENNENTKELDEQVDQAFDRLDAAKNEALPQTYAEIDAFLEAISTAGKYSRTISLHSVKCRVSAEDIRTGLGNSIPNICTNLFKGLFTWYLFHNHDDPISKQPRLFGAPKRIKVKENVKKEHPFYSGILAPIETAFKQEYARRDGFGIVDQVMEDIETHINQAMFLGEVKKEGDGT